MSRGRAIEVLRRIRARVQPTRAEANARWADALRGTPGPRRTDQGRPTHVGPVFDAGVARVRAQMLSPGVDADYDLAYEHFDLEGFLLQAPAFLTMPDADPLLNFLRNGPDALARPEINFSMQEYVARHPHLAEGPERSPYLHWLKRGRSTGEIADPAPGIEQMAEVLGMPTAELAGHLAEARSDLQERLRHQTLGEMIAHAARIEPLVGEAWAETMRPRMLPLATHRVVAQVAAIHRAQKQAGFGRARVVMVVSDPRWGGGRRMEGHLAHALARTIEPADIVVVYTDAGGSAPAGRFPDGVREVDFADAVPPTPEDGDPTDPAELALVALIRSFGAEAVVSVNSMLLYRAMQSYGKALCATERVFPVLFGNEQLEQGNWVGISLRHFYRLYDDVAGLITDSHHLRDWLCERNQLSGELAEKLHVLSAPVEPRFELVPRTPREGRARVYWAGRWDRQKRVDIVLQVARSMPETDFLLWGEAVLSAEQRHELPDNVTVHPPYERFTDLDLARADAWLYTSAWDGVPSMLLEVAMTGVPIVGSLVGGTGEVLDPEFSWPVEAIEDPAAYAAALRAVLADPDAARAKAAGLRERLLTERDEAAFTQRVTDLLLGPAAGNGFESSLGYVSDGPTAGSEGGGAATDLSLIVTAHDETAVCGPTMTAADEAVAEARARGYVVQPIILLDKATAGTTKYFQQPRFDHWERRVMDEGDLGRVRNAVVPETTGRYIAFLDADDLFSRNWLAEGIAHLDSAAERGDRVIVHPELNVFFDGARMVLKLVEQDSPMFTPHLFYVLNYYDSLCMAPRDAHLGVPYVHRDIPNGLSFQDWQFGIETMERGWRHELARDTVIFKRKRDFSLVVESRNRRSIVRSLPAMTIDRVRSLGRSSSPRADAP